MAKKRKDLHIGDKAFYWILKVMAFGIILLLLAFFVLLFKMSWPVLSKVGPSFFWFNDWNPVTEEYGALPFIFGTIATSLIALFLAVPISLGAALLITEIADGGVRKILGFLVEMLAAIPSVVYGLWGLFVVVPFLRETVQPFLSKYFGVLPIFEGAPLGVGLMASGIVLAIMITPTIATISREIFLTIPKVYKEGALALGATRWEMIRLSILKSSVSGILGASILGLGRALGETMAVAMVIGNRAEISASLFSPAQSMASLIANEYAEASGDMHLASLTAIGFGLLIVSFFMNSTARIIVWRVERKYKGTR
ncbi:MAG: phosphate ABC transporter permease subunit PstC [Bdellovibrionota bacterium]